MKPAGMLPPKNCNSTRERESAFSFEIEDHLGKRTYEKPQVVALDQAVFKLTDEPVTIHDSLAVSQLRSLAPGIPELYLSAPRGQHQGASQLAEAAGVSVMSAFRFVEQFSKEGSLESGGGVLRLVWLRELLNRWMAAS